MSKHSTGCATVKTLTQFSKLAKEIDLDVSGMRHFATYEDPTFFFDIIAHTTSGYVNFCQVTPTNRARYEVLCAINEVKSTRLVKSRVGFVVCEGQEWFYEIIPPLQSPVAMCSFNRSQLEDLWVDVDILNNDINKATVTSDILVRHNKFFRDIGYFEQARRTYPHALFEEHAHALNSNRMYMNYADFEKSVELGYVGRQDGHFVFAGLQSIVPCPTIHNRITSTMVLLADTASIKETLHNIDADVVVRVIDIHIRHIVQSPDYYTYDVVPYMNRLKELRHYYE